MFKSAVSQGYPIIAAVEKVQNEALSEIETVFKGQRFKVRYYDNIWWLVPGLSFPGCRGTHPRQKRLTSELPDTEHENKEQCKSTDFHVYCQTPC